MLACRRIKGLAQLGDFSARVRRPDLAVVGGLAAVLRYRQSVAPFIFDRLHGVLGAPVHAAFAALHRRRARDSEIYTEKNSASLRGGVLFFIGISTKNNGKFKRFCA